jgi:iron complex outermembrane recepter protein
MSNQIVKRFAMAALPLFFVSGMMHVRAEDQVTDTRPEAMVEQGTENKSTEKPNAEVLSTDVQNIETQNTETKNTETKNTEKTTTKNLDVPDEIIVSGFRQSLNKAVDAKRSAKNVTDNIHAEDIGKSADQNIGEALSRVTGVSLTRADGEGTSVSIRGAGPNLNNISLNGVQLTSGAAPGVDGGGLSKDFVDLSAFSSDILSRVEVYKTASADLDEGSLGGSVVLHTVKPLDVKRTRRSVEVQGRYGDLAKSSDYKLSGGFTEIFLDETLGIDLTAFSETQTVRRDEVANRQFKPVSLDSNLVTNFKTGQLMGDGTTKVKGLDYQSLNYNAYYNEHERIGGTFAIQFAPTENTDLQFDVTHSQQTVTSDDNSFTTIGAVNGAPSKENIIARYLNRGDGIVTPDPNNPGMYIVAKPEDNDPIAQWNVYDPDTGMFVKRVGRYVQGRTGRSTAVVGTDNTVADLDLEHKEGAFTYNFKVGYSKTHTKDDDNHNVSTNNYNSIDSAMMYGVPADKIEPVGYDCTSGKCRIITGVGKVNPGPDGIVINGREDNTTTTQFNPDDLDAIHLQAYWTRDQFVIDEAKSVFFDVNWDLEDLFITQLEAGVKWSNRNKDIQHGQTWFEKTETTPGFPGGVGSIALKDVSPGNIDYNNFLSGLDYPKDSNTDGWPAVDAKKVAELVFARDDVKRVLDKKGTRQIEVDTKSAYLKANFAFIDDRLKGDLGLRYVETDNTSFGYSGIDYQNVDIQNLPLNLILKNVTNPPCSTTAGLDTSKALTNEQRNARDAEAMASPCYDPVLAIGGDWRSQAQDRTTPIDPEFKVTGEGKSDILLPSVNISYAVKEDLIGRFAASKTMARPTMDSLQPGFVLGENVWGGTGWGSQNNPDLQPLESKNIDLGLEWYFNDNGGMVSAALFHKDYSNFEDTETVKAYMLDVRKKDLSAGVTADQLILENADTGVCFKMRPHNWDNERINNNIGIFDTCREFQIGKKINGKGATIDGLELGYNQNYDFLPGVFSGLGSSLNYTYQKTKAERQKGTFAGSFLPAFPLAYSPEQSYNATLFWERDGHLIRLAYNYATDVLINRSATDGFAIWQEGSGNLDISANYKINDWFSVTFNAINVTGTTTREYATSVTNSVINTALNLPNGEGNALDGATTRRTIREYDTGVIYRLGVRATF